jgi:radical SAM protein with 4Fe4S-binding SPASM domain
MRPWKRITLDARGFVISCEYDHREAHVFGRIDGETTALESWKSEAARGFRRDFNLGHNDFYHCASCTYKDTQADDCIVEVRPLGAPSHSEGVEAVVPRDRSGTLDPKGGASGTVR